MFVLVFDEDHKPLGRYETEYDITKPITIDAIVRLEEAVTKKFPTWKTISHGLVSDERRGGIRYVSPPDHSPFMQVLGDNVKTEDACYLLDERNLVIAMAPSYDEDDVKIFTDWDYDVENLRILDSDFEVIVHDGIV